MAISPMSTISYPLISPGRFGRQLLCPIRADSSEGPATAGLPRSYDFRKTEHEHVRPLDLDRDFIDEKFWEKYVDLKSLDIDATGAPTLDSSIVNTVAEKMSKFLQFNHGVTILTVPRKLSLNKLVQIANSPKLGHPAPIKIDSDVLEKFGDIQVEKTHIVALSNATFGQSFINEQKALLAELGYEMPALLPVATQFILKFISRSNLNLLYGGFGYLYTMCSERLNDNAVLAGGFFDTPPFALGKDRTLFEIYTEEAPLNWWNCGLAAMHVFEETPLSKLS